MSEPTTPGNPQPTPANDPIAANPAGPQFLPAGESYPATPQVPPVEDLPPGVQPAVQPVATPDPGYGYGSPEDLAAYATAPVPAGPERVGRGILFSLLAVALGAVLSAAIFQLGFIASITSFAMAWGACWLYTRGAGAPPKKGVVPLIAVIVLGVIISLFVILSVALYSEIAAEFPTATFGDIMPFVMELLFDGEVWGNFLVDAGMYVLFAALGTFTTLRQLGRQADPAA